MTTYKCISPTGVFRVGDEISGEVYNRFGNVQKRCFRSIVEWEPKHTELIVKSFEPLREDWMSDEDFKDVVDEIINKMGETYQSLSNAIDVGIRNGYSAEVQLKLTQGLITLQNENKR